MVRFVEFIIQYLKEIWILLFSVPIFLGGLLTIILDMHDRINMFSDEELKRLAKKIAETKLNSIFGGQTHDNNQTD